MDQLLSDPLVQSAAVPLVTALVSGVLLYRIGWFWAGLSVPLGFYASAWLVTGMQLLPLTSTHKILLLGFVAAIAGLALDGYRGRRRFAPWLLFVAGAAAALWIVWPVVARREGWRSWSLAAGAGLYVGWLMAASAGLRSRPLGAAAMVLSLALGTAVCAVFGASTLLGQLAASIAAAAGAYLLLALLWPRPRAGSTLVTPAVLLCGLLGLSGCVYARLPWHSAAVLAAVPLLARTPLGRGRNAWVTVALQLLLTLPAAGLAILVARHIAGPLPAL